MRIAIILLAAAIFLPGCCTNSDTGKTEFKPVECVTKALSVVAEKVEKVDDGTKAEILEGVAYLTGALGGGGVLTLICQKGAAYYRRRKEQKQAQQVEESEVCDNEALRNEDCDKGIDGILDTKDVL